MSNKIAVCRNVTNVIDVPEPPDNGVLLSNGVLLTSDRLPPGISLPDSPGAKIQMRDGSFKSIQDLPKRFDVSVDRSSGRCQEFGSLEYSMLTSITAALILLIGVTFTYAYARLHRQAPSAAQHIRNSSFLLSGSFFCVATVALFSGITGSVELMIGTVRLNSALPGVILYLFSLLVWNRATKLPTHTSGAA